MHPGGTGDPVEEITLRIANLELTLRVRSVGPAGSSTTASTTSLGGFEVVSSGPVGTGPVREPLVSPAVEENILNASTGAALSRFTITGVEHFTTRLRGSSGEWTPKSRIYRAFRAGLIARRRLDGEYLEHSSPGLPFRSSYYVILRSTLFPSGCWTQHYQLYVDSVRDPRHPETDFGPTSVSHGFATQAECEAYLAGAARPWPTQI